jgi:Putative lumazine-binding
MKFISKLPFILLLLMVITVKTNAQTKQDTLDIERVALDYIVSQHKPNGEQMKNALHPRLVKRTFWKDKESKIEYVRETNAEVMVIVAETFNKDGKHFPENPKKQIKFLDISERTASVKLIADEWIDYMHIVKVNGKWQIVNVLWQYHDATKHQ